MTIIFSFIGIIISITGLVGCVYLFYLNYKWGRDMHKLIDNASEEELKQIEEAFKWFS